MMLDISATRLIDIVVHRVRNRFREEGYKLADAPAKRSPAVDDLVIRHYMREIARTGEPHVFHHETDISLNIMKNISSSLLKNEDFISDTQKLSKYLYSLSTHPKIEGGDLMFCLLEDIKYNEEKCRAIAILWLESKVNYIEIEERDGAFRVMDKTGISLERLQKAVLIAHRSEIIYIVDNSGKSAKYWTEKFIGAKPSGSEKVARQIFLSAIKGFQSKIKNPTKIAEFNNEILSACNDGPLVLEDVRRSALAYASEDSIGEVYSALENNHGPINDVLELPKEASTKLVLKMCSDVQVGDLPVSLKIKDNRLRLRHLMVEQSESRAKATIEFSYEDSGDKDGR